MNKISKRLFSIMMAVAMLLSCAMSIAVPGTSREVVVPEAPNGYAVFSIEAFSLGLGYIVEPTLVRIEAGMNAAEGLVQILEANNLEYVNTGSVESGFYLSGIGYDYNEEDINIPESILEEINGSSGDNGDGMLGEFDFGGNHDWGNYAGWMYFANNCGADVGFSDWELNDGDVIRTQFSIYGFGADIGFPPDFVSESTLPNRDEITTLFARINGAENYAELMGNANVVNAYNEAMAITTNIEATADQINGAFATLTDAVNNLTEGGTDYTADLNGVLDYIAQTVTNPTVASVGGEWAVMALARGEYFDDFNNSFYDTYYQNLCAKLIESDGILHSRKYTEYSRVIIALSSIGKDARDVAGYDLTQKLAEYDNVVWQGLNGAVYALIALDTVGYEIPAPADASLTAATRDMYLDFILSKEISGGGFALSGTAADPDMTAMTLIALAKYRDREDVAAAIDRALNKLSSLQNAQGGFSSWGTVNAESCAQAITALSELGINPMTDERFIKNGNSIVDALLSFRVSGSGFAHASGGAVNMMASEQSAYALVGLDRFLNGKTSLYNMKDVFVPAPPVVPTEPKVILSMPESVQNAQGTTFNATIAITAMPDGEYKLLDGIMTIPTGISVKNMTASNAISGGELKFNLDNEGKLRFVYSNTTLEPIVVSTSGQSTILFTVELEAATELTAGQALNFAITGMSLKNKSDGTGMFIFDIAEAIASVNVTESPKASVKVLFEGDGVDLIPDGHIAIAISITAIEGKKAEHSSGITLYYSDEITQLSGVNTFIALVGNGTDIAQFADMTKYVFTDGANEGITLGDVDGNGVVNAQDALDILSAWLRMTDAPTGKKVLTMNANSDSRINTLDALAVLENFVNGDMLAIINKAVTE